MSKETGMTVHKIRQLQDEVKISVTTTAIAYTLDVGNGYVVFQNTGSKSIWMGGDTVDADTQRGYKLVPTATWIFESILEQCKVYFQCASGDSSQISVIKG